jgi:hypothetical protein
MSDNRQIIVADMAREEGIPVEVMAKKLESDVAERRFFLVEKIETLEKEAVLYGTTFAEQIAQRKATRLLNSRLSDLRMRARALNKNVEEVIMQMREEERQRLIDDNRQLTLKYINKNVSFPRDRLANLLEEKVKKYKVIKYGSVEELEESAILHDTTFAEQVAQRVLAENLDVPFETLETEARETGTKIEQIIIRLSEERDRRLKEAGLSGLREERNRRNNLYRKLDFELSADRLVRLGRQRQQQKQLQLQQAGQELELGQQAQQLLQ